MAHRGGLAGVKHEYMEIGEVNFSWPGHNGTLQDFGAVNYTMPSGDFLTSIFPYSIFKGFICSISFAYKRHKFFFYFQVRGIGRGVLCGGYHNILYSR